MTLADGLAKGYYPGQNATTYNQVTIATDQAQIAPNNSAHLGTSGDCGTATAVKQADGTYSFKLDHKAAYLCLLPRTPNKLVSTYVQQIKVMSDNNIAGIYTLTKAGLTGSGSSNAITLTTKTNAKGSAYFDGFPLDNSDTNQSRNVAYIVIAPGTHTLTIEYTLYDNITNVRGTFTKKISSATYSENTVYPITANINPTDYSSDVYYMWDAEIGQHYWKGYESDQPNIASANNGNYPKDNSDSRWYNQVMGYRPHSSAVSASRTCASCPNVNELLWYALKGDPHWDVSIWTTMGHLYAGIKKDGYDIDVNDNDTLAFTQKGSSMNAVITMYFTNDGNPQNLKAAFKSVFAPQFRLKYTDEFETNRAYIQKSFRNNSDGTVYGYNIIAKNQKRKGCYINVFLISTQEFPDELLEELAITSLDEVESYLK